MRKVWRQSCFRAGRRTGSAPCQTQPWRRRFLPKAAAGGSCGVSRAVPAQGSLAVTLCLGHTPSPVVLHRHVRAALAAAAAAPVQTWLPQGGPGHQEGVWCEREEPVARASGNRKMSAESTSREIAGKDCLGNNEVSRLASFPHHLLPLLPLLMCVQRSFTVCITPTVTLCNSRGPVWPGSQSSLGTALNIQSWLKAAVSTAVRGAAACWPRESKAGRAPEPLPWLCGVPRGPAQPVAGLSHQLGGKIP